MSFDFDAPVERAGSDSTKWGRYAGRDIIPLWVADMDFAATPAQDADQRASPPRRCARTGRRQNFFQAALRTTQKQCYSLWLR